MHSSAVVLTLLLAWASAAASQQGSSSSTTPASLDYEFFKTRVQPIFLAKREGHARCVSCHTSGTPLRLEPLTAGSTAWS